MFGLSSRNKKVAVGIVLLAIAVRAGLWFMRSVPLCSWQANFLRVSHQPRAEGYDAVVIVGYAINYDRLEPTPQLRERLDAGAELLCDLTNGGPKTMADRAASHVVLSGGLARQQNVTESVVMARYLLKYYGACFRLSKHELIYDPNTPIIEPNENDESSSGSSGSSGSSTLAKASVPIRVVPVLPAAVDSHIWLIPESKSYSTRTNAQFSYQLWKLITAPPTAPATASSPPPPAQKPVHFLVITNPFHQYRTYHVFEKIAADQRSQPDGMDFRLTMHDIQPRAEQLADADRSDHSASSNTTDRSSFGKLPQLLMPQKDWWRELLAIALYRVRGWI